MRRAEHVIGWWVHPRFRRWQERSSPEQVEASTRWILASYAWVMLLCFVVQLLPNTGPGALPVALSCGVLATGLAQCVLCTRLLPQALDSYLGARAVSRAQFWLRVVLLALPPVLVGALVGLDAVEGGVTVGLALYGVLSPFALVFSIVLPRRITVAFAFGYALLSAGILTPAGMPGGDVLTVVSVLVLGGLACAFTGRSSAWYIAVIRELEEARGAQARLAVAEERLRFSRDLHDVMGRNLSAIALKSELAAELVRRGAPAETSVEQMAEVQRIARDSQTEVRAVVRGYRNADLATELAGARGILRAAGVDCRAENEETVLSAPVQAALGWVVREGATNVLRHADASWCTVKVGTGPSGRSAVLTMENDGARQGVHGPEGGRTGAGLAGLRERLAGVGGTLHVAHDSKTGTFRLTAEVPAGSGTASDGPGAGGKETAK